MEGWKKTELGLIPVDWEQSVLYKYAEKPQYGFTDSSSNSGNAKFLRITDITSSGVNWDDVPFCNCPDIEKYKLVNGDIVFARIGATTGKSYIINNPPKAVFASYLIRIHFVKNVSNELYWYFSKSQFYWVQANHLSSGSAQPHFNGKALKEVIFSYPKSEKKQKELIIEFKSLLDEVEKLQTHYQQKLNNLEELKKSILQKAFKGKLTSYKL